MHSHSSYFSWPPHSPSLPGLTFPQFMGKTPNPPSCPPNLGCHHPACFPPLLPPQLMHLLFCPLPSTSQVCPPNCPLPQSVSISLSKKGAFSALLPYSAPATVVTRNATKGLAGQGKNGPLRPCRKKGKVRVAALREAKTGLGTTIPRMPRVLARRRRGKILFKFLFFALVG